jgi:hypothetical protein
MQDTLKERLIEFIKSQGLSQGKFEKRMNFSNGYVNSISKGIGGDKLQRIIGEFPQLNSDLKNALVTQYAELNGTGNNYFYVDRKQGYRLSSAILHVYDTGYIRVEAISQEVNNENCYVLWTNNSYPQNKKIGCDLVWIKENFLWN